MVYTDGGLGDLFAKHNIKIEVERAAA